VVGITPAQQVGADPRRPRRTLSSSHPACPSTLRHSKSVSLLNGWPAHPRSQKLGPTGSVKSLLATRNALESVVSGNWAAGARPGRRSRSRRRCSNVDWWHGHRMSVRGLLVQRHRAPHLRADLGVATIVVDVRLVPTSVLPCRLVGMCSSPAGT